MDKKLKIGFLVTHPIQYLSPLFAQLSELADIMVFYAHKQSAKGQADAGFGVEFEWDVNLLEGYPYLWLNNIAKNPTVSNFFGCDTPEIKQHIREGNFDAFIIVGWNKKSFVQAITACKSAHVPVFIRGDSRLGGSRSFWKRLLKYPVYRLLLPIAGSYLSPGHRHNEYLRHFGVKKETIFHVPHFVDNDRFRLETDVFLHSKEFNGFKRNWGISDADFVVLFVGKLIPTKRPQDLIEACISLGSKPGISRRIIGVIVGDGVQFHELEKMGKTSQAHIVFAGFQNQSQLHKWYALANAMVLPSNEDETWGLVLNEALASGVPIIASKEVGAAPDLIREGVTGFTYECGNVGDLAKSIEKSMRLNKNSPEVQKNIRKISDEYSLEAATSGLFKAIYSVQKRDLVRK